MGQDRFLLYIKKDKLVSTKFCLKYYLNKAKKSRGKSWLEPATAGVKYCANSQKNTCVRVSLSNLSNQVMNIYP